jgi:Family of unknown function (DUF6272)
MPELELLEYYKKMCERHIVLDFQGAMSQDMLVGMAELIRNTPHREVKKPTLIKRVFSVFIEMAQNIAHYSIERVHLNSKHQKDGVGAGIIVVTENKKMYTVTSGNLVDTSSIIQITQRCDAINKMDKEELKQFYKQQIKVTRPASRRGAGVGLIDIARKSGNAIQYQTTCVDDLKSFLVLSVKIHEEKKNGQSSH